MAPKKRPNKSKAWKKAPAYKPLGSLLKTRPDQPVAPETPVNPAPWEEDASYQRQMTDFTEQRDMRDQNLVSRRDRSLADAGYTMDFSTGALSPVAAADNPYSRAALMKAAYDRSVKATTNSAASRGQYYSGALDRQRVADADRYTGQVNELIGRLRDMNEDVESGLGSSRASYESAVRRAQEEAINRAAEAPPPEQGEAAPWLRSPKYYQKQINQLLKNQPKTKARTKRIKELIALRNQSERQQNG